MFNHGTSWTIRHKLTYSPNHIILLLILGSRSISVMNENIPSQKRANFSSLNGVHKQSVTGNLKGGTGKKLTIKNFKGSFSSNFIDVLGNKFLISNLRSMLFNIGGIVFVSRILEVPTSWFHVIEWVVS